MLNLLTTAEKISVWWFSMVDASLSEGDRISLWISSRKEHMGACCEMQASIKELYGTVWIVEED